MTEQQPTRRGGRRRLRAPNGKPRYTPVAVLLEPTMIEDLDKVVEAENLDSRSSLIRRACDLFLRRWHKRQGGKDAEED